MKLAQSILSSALISILTIAPTQASYFDRAEQIVSELPQGKLNQAQINAGVQSIFKAYPDIANGTDGFITIFREAEHEGLLELTGEQWGQLGDLQFDLWENKLTPNEFANRFQAIFSPPKEPPHKKLWNWAKKIPRRITNAAVTPKSAIRGFEGNFYGPMPLIFGTAFASVFTFGGQLIGTEYFGWSKKKGRVVGFSIFAAWMAYYGIRCLAEEVRGKKC